MSSRLLLSEAHLPTIRETLEKMLPGWIGQGPPASPSLDDYIRSICQLAQPTSVLSVATARGLCGSLGDITTYLRGQQPALHGAGTSDPLHWLFGESQQRWPSRRELPRTTGPSAESRGPCGQMYSSKAGEASRGSPCDARLSRHFLARPSREWQQGSLTPRQSGRAAASPTRSCPSSVLRTLYLLLPVIHEL